MAATVGEGLLAPSSLLGTCLKELLTGGHKRAAVGVLTVRALIKKPLRPGHGSLSFSGFSGFLVVVPGFPAWFSTPLGLFQSLCFCGGVSVD